MERGVAALRVDKWQTRFRRLAVRKEDPDERAHRIRMRRLRDRKKPLQGKKIIQGVQSLPGQIWRWVRRYLPCKSWRAYEDLDEYGEGDKKVRTVEAGFDKKRRYKGNGISTTKYNFITFIPKNLFEQFRRLANIWFLITCIIQLIPGISPLNPASSIVPLVFVLAVTAIKEAFEDIKRRGTDIRVNGQKVAVLKSNGMFTKTKWHKLRVGDIVRVENNKDVPADLLLLSTAHSEGIAYIETANLDGETNLKVRQALEETVNKLSSAQELLNWKGIVSYEQPNAELYSFEGILKLEGQEDIPINLEQTVWRGSTLRNTQYVIGMVLYTGMETKIMKNSRDPPSKRSTIEIEMNRALFTIFFFAIALDFTGGLLSGVWAQVRGFDHWYLSLKQIESSAAVLGLEAFAAWLILLAVIIPISLYIYLELVKLIMVYWINNDVTMYDKESNTRAKANTSNLAEDLGRIEYIFSDKTGTLTCNQMDFMRCSIGGKVYGEVPTYVAYPQDDVSMTTSKGKHKEGDSEDDTEEHHTQHTENIAKLEALDNDDDDDNDDPLHEDKIYEAPIFQDKDLLDAIDGENEAVGEFFRLLALCNTVLIESDTEGGHIIEEGPGESEFIKSVRGSARSQDKPRVYQAASPDESALVEAARKLGFELAKRDVHNIWISVAGREEKWELLNVLEFNSDRKRMSVILRDPRDGQIKLLCKGADSVIFERLAAGQDDLLQTTLGHLETFGMEGLRTLCLAVRVIPEQDYLAWQERYYNASVQINGREQAMDEVAEGIEKDLILLGATAIEDKLQEGVPEAIAMLMKAGIKMWVLTGDKMETAINIGYSCSLLNNDMHQIVLSSEKTDDPAQVPITSSEAASSELERFAGTHFPKSRKADPAAKAAAYASGNNSLGEPLLDNQMSEGDPDHTPSEIGSPISIDNVDVDGSLPLEVTKKYALIIDGKALAQYLPSTGFTDLSASFLDIAVRCKSVICCRVSPLQKALVVKLVKRGLKATTLAIGDGANDVPMIQQAHIGIGISGKEGRQAVMAADYAIAQFRFLVTLLLVHGYWSYRRMALLLLYSFYKNVIFAMSNFWFGMYSAFSAQSLYNSWAVSIYNITFTGYPILMLAAFDRPTSKQQIMKYPQLYERGIRGKDFSQWQLWGWILTAIAQSAIITWFALFAFSNNNVAANGNELGIWAMGNTIFTSVILVVNFKIFLITHTWTVYNHIALYFSVAIWFIFLIVYTFIPQNYFINPNELYWDVPNFMSTAVFWLTPLLSTATAVLPDFAFKYVHRMYKPRDYHIVQELREIENRRADKVKRQQRLRKIRGKLKIPALQRKTKNTGYAFSQAEGASDLLFTLGMAPVPTPAT